MSTHLPTSVRYVKNGRNHRWWQAARSKGQVHFGWKDVSRELLQEKDFEGIEQAIKAQYGARPGAGQDFNALRDALDKPSQYLWITFEDSFMWWCTVGDKAILNPEGESAAKGNFWLECDRPWSNASVKGRPLAIPELPGTVTATAGFRATVCQPKDWRAMLRIIRDDKDPDAARSAKARLDYEAAVGAMVRKLSWKDFEQLIDLILTRTGWARISTLGKTREGIDIEAQNLTADEIAFVQVKSSATQSTLDDYIRRFSERRELYARMIFAVHSPKGELTPSPDLPVQVWVGSRVTELAVRLGLGEWIEDRLA